MAELMDQLITDHKNMERLLDILDVQVKSFVLNIDDEESDFFILMEALEYISVYPQKWHHPVEELVFEHLLKYDLNEREKQSIYHIQEQHKALEKSTNEVENLFLSVANGTIIPMQSITESFSRFLDFQREHLEAENYSVYPLMMEKISEADWLEIEGKIEQVADPFFMARAEQEFNALHRFMISVEEHRRESI